MRLEDLDLDLAPSTAELELEVVGGNHENNQYYHRLTGEHYALLRHLAKQFDNCVLVDIGTYLGLSALALSGSSNRVLSLDVTNARPAGLQLPSNVICKLANMIEDPSVFPIEASLAVLDVDPHDGLKERAVVQQLLNRGWRGLMVCDDIKLNGGMRAFWQWAQGLPGVETMDVTEIGHCTGTGLINFQD